MTTTLLASTKNLSVLCIFLQNNHLVVGLRDHALYNFNLFGIPGPTAGSTDQSTVLCSSAIPKVFEKSVHSVSINAQSLDYKMYYKVIYLYGMLKKVRANSVQGVCN